MKPGGNRPPGDNPLLLIGRAKISIMNRKETSPKKSLLRVFLIQLPGSRLYYHYQHDNIRFSFRIQEWSYFSPDTVECTELWELTSRRYNSGRYPLKLPTNHDVIPAGCILLIAGCRNKYHSPFSFPVASN